MPSALAAVTFFGLLLLIPTAYAGKIGAPYAPTFSAAIKNVFGYIGLGKQDVVVDLGAGDGRVLLEAKKRGATAIGYELSPITWAVAWLRLLGTTGHSRLFLKNFYKQKLPPETTVIFTFLMPEHMEKLRQVIAKQFLPNGRYLISYCFPIKSLHPTKILHTPKCARMFVYDLSDIVEGSTPT